VHSSAAAWESACHATRSSATPRVDLNAIDQKDEGAAVNRVDRQRQEADAIGARIEPAVSRSSATTALLSMAAATMPRPAASLTNMYCGGMKNH
jgi:hypothetical protein